MDRSERLDLGDEEQVKLHEEIEPNSDEYEYEDGPDMVEDEEMNGQDGPAMNEELAGREEEDQDDAMQRQEVAQARRKRKEFEVFVGGLDRDATEEDLRKVFGEVGEITEVRLMKIPMTQKNKGFAFLRFATVEQARRAVNELKHPVVNGKQCGVSPSQDSDTLFVGNICRTWTKEVLKEKLAKYGVDKFEELTLVEDAKNEGTNRGFAFLDFSSRPDALDACKQLQKRDVTLGTDRPAKVAFADTFIEPDDEIMAQVRTVFLDGLPPNWDEERVIDYLTKFGKIEKAELARNMPAAKRQDFGFVTFDTHDAAVACVEGINSAELNDGDKKIKVRARLSRPRQRVRPGRHGGGGYLGHSGSRGGRAFWGPSSRVDSWSFSGRNARGMEGRSAYRGGFRWTENTRDRYPVADVGLDRVGSRRHLPPLEKFVDRRSPPYAKMSWKRDYMQHDEPYSRSSDFASRDGLERHLSYRDHVYSSRGPDYFESPSGASRSATRRSSLYAEESYGQRTERPSNYRDSQTRDYSSISGRKRPHSPMDDIPLRYVDSIGRNTRTRYNYGASSAALPYVESDRYAHESSRLGRESNLEYEGESRRSAGRSHGLYDSHTSSMSYSRGGVSKGDTGGMYSSYGRDYLSRGEDLGGDSYSSMYSSRGMNDGYVSGRGSYY